MRYKRPSSTKSLTDKAYPLGSENTNTDAQPFFDFENVNVVDSHEESYAKKALDYAIRVDNVDKFVSYLEKFIERMKADIDEESNENVIIGDPIRVKHKGCQPKCYRSEGEVLPRKKKLQNIRDTSNVVAESSTGSSNAKS
ncbi:3683_t:CDS:2, partial [Gigaspora rosea]